jgi:monovalent cation/hydrogen antiporter
VVTEAVDPRVPVALGDFEFVILLLAAATVLIRLADSIAVPYPIVLVVGGLAIGLVPGLPELELDPEAVFVIFLPPLLFAAAWRSSPRELRAEIRPLALLSIGLVLATMLAVAVVAHAIVPGMSWEAAFVLGAVVGPTDPVAAIATYSRIGVPPRVRLLVEGEAMINDGTALVAFRVALLAAVEGTFSLGDAVLEFFVNAAGGVAAGIAIGWFGTQVLRRQSDVSLSIFVTLITAYSSYIVAEELLHLSGVLAVVAGGIYSGWNAHSAMDGGTRLSAGAFWTTMVFTLEAILFVLLGLQAPLVADELDVAELSAQALVVALTVVAVRMAWAAMPGGASGLRERIAIGWSGMRGAVSLAAALSVPATVEEQPQILLLTFGVIAVTLLGQGLTLPPLLKLLRLPSGDNPFSPDEALARLEAAQAALDRLEELEEEGAAEEPLRRLRELYRRRFAVCVAVLGGGELPEDGRRELREYGAMRHELIAVERAALLGLRNDGRVSQDVVRKVERDLDLEEARLRT